MVCRSSSDSSHVIATNVNKQSLPVYGHYIEWSPFSGEYYVPFTENSNGTLIFEVFPVADLGFPGGGRGNLGAGVLTYSSA